VLRAAQAGDFRPPRCVDSTIDRALEAVCLKFQFGLALIHNNIGMMFSATGKPAETLAAFEKGRAIRQTLADANPSVTGFQRDLAISLLMIGQFRQGEGQMAGAAADYRKALAILERLPVLASGTIRPPAPK